ncbi:hypothetical protein LUZ60_014352 [Juncus effusus]|nr:hypothetical protein LUZ60_014352 [Juncus effusus]
MDFHQTASLFSNSEIINHQRRRKEMEAPPLQSCSSSLFMSSSLLSDLAPQINQQRNQIDQVLHDHCERLRRALAETLRRQHLSLISSAESVSARHLREKEAELDRAARLKSELEDRLSLLKSDLMTWQSKALSNQSTAASLHARLQQATTLQPATQQPKTEEPDSSNQAEDCESAHIDPNRPPGSARLCKVCRHRTASVVLLPCRHLCLCESCDVAAACEGACPVCHCVCTGCVQVFLS